MDACCVVVVKANKAATDAATIPNLSILFFVI
jgi:hypothetical protein